MLTISTIPEALAELAEQTGRAWTDSELFDMAANHGIELHAAPPITAQTTIQKFVIGEGLVEKFRSGPGHSRLAVLFPWQVGQLWLSGETMARHTEKHDEIEGEYQWFTEPVRVTREQVRIKAATLENILSIWRKEQPAPATDIATPAPVVAASDVPAPLPAVPNWKMKVQTEATDLVLRLRKSGANPTKHSILDTMAQWCRDNDIKTPTKINPSANYLRTHVLGGKHWDVPN